MKEKFLSKYKTVGKNVRRLRKEKGWSQDDLAYRCSVNAEKISRIENARKDFMFGTILEICDAFNIDLEELMRA